MCLGDSPLDYDPLVGFAIRMPGKAKPKRPTPKFSSRKRPKQARANDLVSAVLHAAIQVLRSEGAARFTTIRVAKRAGVSVGSLYQYFPNKASILFRLQSDEWRQTSERMREIITEPTKPPLERLRSLVHFFLRSECDEAAVRIALSEAAPDYRGAPEAEEARALGSQLLRTFLQETLPGLASAEVAMAARLLESTLAELGSSFSDVERSEEEIAAYADAMADMFCAYLRALQTRAGACEAASR